MMLQRPAIFQPEASFAHLVEGFGQHGDFDDARQRDGRIGVDVQALAGFQMADGDANVRAALGDSLLDSRFQVSHARQSSLGGSSGGKSARGSRS